MIAPSLRFTKVIRVTSPTNNLNVRTLAGVASTIPVTVLLFLNAAVGSASAATPSFDTGTDWHSKSKLFVYQNANISAPSGTAGLDGLGGVAGGAGYGNPAYTGAPGYGGNGTNGGAGTAGTNGGSAIKVRLKTVWSGAGYSLTAGNGGGGGRGGGGGGGGGYGSTSAIGVDGTIYYTHFYGGGGGRGEGRDGAAASGQSGTTNGGQTSGNGGNGGAFSAAGQAGSNSGSGGGVPGAAGAAGANGTNGYAIDGIANLTFSATPAIIGATI